jgi:DNA invertase Pin-like site-specific DNA recombinase
LTDLVLTLKELAGLEVAFISLTEAIDMSTPIGRAMAGLLAVFAEFERELLRERVKAGIAHARKKGGKHGRPASTKKYASKVKELHGRGISQAEIARRLSIGRSSVRRILASR